MQSCEDGFDRFMEQFEEHASLAGWSEEHKYHLKLHLSKRAFQTYRLLPDSVRASYSETVEALRKCFKPVDVEELQWFRISDL